MIDLILISGMGNQMFEYAYARLMQEVYKNETILINNRYMQKHDFRTYSLNHFRLNENVRVLSEKEAGKDLWLFYLRLLVAVNKDLFRWRIHKKPVTGEKVFNRRSKLGGAILDAHTL